MAKGGANAPIAGIHLTVVSEPKNIAITAEGRFLWRRSGPVWPHSWR